MSVSISQIKDHLTGMSRGASIDDIVNPYQLMERASITMLTTVDPIDTVRMQALSQVIHDDIYNYPLRADYKKLIDLYPQAERKDDDIASRIDAEKFDVKKTTDNKTVSIEGNDGEKFIRINWKARQGKVLHAMNSLTDNGTWVNGLQTTATTDTLTKVSGSGSIRLDISAGGGGSIENATMKAVDLSEWDGQAEFFFWLYIPDTTVITSASVCFGNDLTTNFFTSNPITTQSDGSAFRVGWNLLKFSWPSSEDGTVDVSNITALWVGVETDAAIKNVRIDNIIASLGRDFDMKYYSQYIFKNSAGTWISIPTTDDDTCVLSGTALQVYLLECLIAIYQQSKVDAKDYNFAKTELAGMYQRYRAEYPSESKPLVFNYWGSPRYNRRG